MRNNGVSSTCAKTMGLTVAACMLMLTLLCFFTGALEVRMKSTQLGSQEQ
jgi:hypothetical protein